MVSVKSLLDAAGANNAFANLSDSRASIAASIAPLTLFKVAVSLILLSERKQSFVPGHLTAGAFSFASDSSVLGGERWRRFREAC